MEIEDILTSDKVYHIVQDNNARESTFLASFSVFQYNIQWHPAFCSAMELELRENKKHLRYEREHNLGKMPLKIDFLVIRKNSDVIIKNDIGVFSGT